MPKFTISRARLHVETVQIEAATEELAMQQAKRSENDWHVCDVQDGYTYQTEWED